MFDIKTIELNDLTNFLIKPTLKERRYGISDTNISSRQMNYWEEKDILLLKHRQHYTHRFSFAEVLWLRLVSKLREFTISFETIQEIKTKLTAQSKLSEYLNEPNFKECLSIALDKTEYTDSEKEEIKSNSKLTDQQMNLTITYFDIMISQILDNKNRVSLIIAIGSKNEVEELLRSENQDWLTLFVPEKLEDLSRSKTYFEIFTHNHISISLNDLLEDVILNISYKKLPYNVFGLSNEEKQIMDFIRSGRYKSVCIRFDDGKKPYLMELTEIKKLKKESRLYEIIYKGAYQNIEISTQQGEIYSCKSTRKIKLN